MLGEIKFAKNKEDCHYELRCELTFGFGILMCVYFMYLVDVSHKLTRKRFHLNETTID